MCISKKKLLQAFVHALDGKLSNPHSYQTGLRARQTSLSAFNIQILSPIVLSPIVQIVFFPLPSSSWRKRKENRFSRFLTFLSDASSKSSDYSLFFRRHLNLIRPTSRASIFHIDVAFLACCCALRSHHSSGGSSRKARKTTGLKTLRLSSQCADVAFTFSLENQLYTSVPLYSYIDIFILFWTPLVLGKLAE